MPQALFYVLCEGKGTVVIARELNEDHVPTWTESFKGEEGKGRWRSNSIIAIARNEFYTGDSLYQKTFMDEGYRKRVNTGQLDQYLNEADHPAIIDHDTFRRANEAIREHGEAFGNGKTQRTAIRYVFSGRLRCGCCGGHMSCGKDAKAYYACGNHLHKRPVRRDDGTQGTEPVTLAACPMLPVFEQDVKNAFATALNRLAAQPSILDALAKLEKKNPAEDLRRAVIKRGVREAFEISNERLFRTFVDRVVLWSKEKAQFHFTCGLVVEEDMRVQKVGRSYAQLPVRTEFDDTQEGAFTWQ